MDGVDALVFNSKTVPAAAGKHVERDHLYDGRSTPLLLALQAKDQQLYIHSQRVQQLTRYLTQLLHLVEEASMAFDLAALLHDIGKLVIRNKVLRKPSCLTQEEFEHIKQHPVYGALILCQVRMARDIVLPVYHHHEHWDGSGYPSGLRGRAIPLGARIVALADAFEAMTSARAYQALHSPFQALEELRRCAGTQFDPLLVDLFCTHLEAGLPNIVQD
jgi:cyclic di-GMP phosphodiesterase